MKTCIKHTRHVKPKKDSSAPDVSQSPGVSPVLDASTSTLTIIDVSDPTSNSTTTSSKTQAQKSTSAPTNAQESVTWEALLDEIREQAKGAIEIDRFARLDADHVGVTGETMLIRANTIMEEVKHAAGYRFKYVSYFRFFV